MSGSGSSRRQGRRKPSPTTSGRDRRAPGAREAVVYGRNPVREALRAGRREVRRVWATRAASGEAWLHGVGVTLAEPDELEARAGSDAHQGICAAVAPYPYVDAAGLLAGGAGPPLVVALDEVQDPQNLGAIARSAECAGATGLVVPERRSAEVTAAAAKASAGAVEHLAIARVRNLADFLGEAKGAGLWCHGADAGAPTSYADADWTVPAVLVLGAEGRGLRPRVRASCDLLVSLPLRGRIASLNVGATAAAVLYEAVRQRGG